MDKPGGSQENPLEIALPNDLLLAFDLCQALASDDQRQEEASRKRQPVSTVAYPDCGDTDEPRYSRGKKSAHDVPGSLGTNQPGRVPKRDSKSGNRGLGPNKRSLHTAEVQHVPARDSKFRIA
jgi:hypothetical protein